MDLDIVHIHQKPGYTKSYRNKDMVRFNFWVTSDPMSLNGRSK